MITFHPLINCFKIQPVKYRYTFSLLAFGGLVFLAAYFDSIPRFIPTTQTYTSDLGQCESSNTNFIPGVEGFLEASELIRARFIKKRNDKLIRNQPLSRINPWQVKANQFFWHYFQPTLTCPHLIERIGKPSDGGKWVCGFNLFEKNKINGVRNDEPCIVYSFGVSGALSFEEEFLRRTNCTVYVFDFFANRMFLKRKIRSSRFKFTKKGLSGVRNGSDMYSTLDEFMGKNEHTWIDFLKIDIEGSEYKSLEYILEQFQAFPFGHLNIQIHLPTQQEGGYSSQGEGFQKFYKWWNTLESGGLRAFIWESNYQPTLKFESKPITMEYGFINVQALEDNRLLQF